MNENPIIITERVDDIPLLLEHMQRMGLPALFDHHFPTHGNWQLTVRPFFLEFRKFQLIESLELMRFPHFWGKLAAHLPPKLQTTEETRFSFQLVNSLETKLPKLRISFQNKRTARDKVCLPETYQNDP